MTMKKKVGILGGSFDPPHFGHLNLAISLQEACLLDEVLFVPAGLSPFKKNALPVAPSIHRLAMLELAIDPILKFRVLDSELHDKGPSYTIDTVRKLSEDPTLELHLLIGEDHFAFFHRWKEPEELMRLAPPLIGVRAHQPLGDFTPVQQKLQKGKVAIPLFDVSSTAVRMRLAQKKYCGHLVPSIVLDYILKHNLYSRPLA